MRFSRVPLLSLLSLIFTFAVDVVLANASPKNDAEVTVVDIFAVNYPIVAYVLGSGYRTDKNTATTYLIACSSDTPTSDCNFNQPYTLTQGPSTIAFQFTSPMPTSTGAVAVAVATQSFTLGCDLASTTSMSMQCSATGLAADVDSPVTTSQTFAFAGTQAEAFFKEVRVVTRTEDLLTHTPGTTSVKALVTGGAVFFEAAKLVSGAATTATATSVGVVHAQASVAPSAVATKTSGANGRGGEGLGALYMGLLMMGGVLGVGLL